MIKELLLTAALIAPPGLAYAQVSGTLNGPVVDPSGDPPVPAPAAAAGFTTLAVNADFSQPQYTNLANWLYFCGATTFPSFSWWGLNENTGAPCANIDLENDPSIGKQVLHTHQSAANGNAGEWLAFEAAPGRSNTNGFPIELYVQITFKTTLAALSQGTAGYIFGGELVPTYDPNGNIEADVLELLSNSNSGSGWQYGDGTLEWGPSCYPNSSCGIFFFTPPPNYPSADMTQYHTIGVLFTSDGSTNYYKCNYLDGQKLNCGGFNVADPSVLAVHTNALQFDTGGGIGQIVTNDIDVYIQSIQVWTCPGSYGTSVQCAGTVITH